MKEKHEMSKSEERAFRNFFLHYYVNENWRAEVEVWQRAEEALLVYKSSLVQHPSDDGDETNKP